MSDSLFQFLEEQGVGKDSVSDKFLSRLVGGMKLTEFVDLFGAISKKLPRGPSEKATPFTFVGTNSLIGESVPCAALGCRLERVGALAHFAALYSDRVYVPNSIDVYEIATSFRVSEDELPRLVQDAFVFLAAIFLLKPLIQKGLVAFADTKHHRLCTGCYARVLGENKGTYKKKLDQLTSFLEERYATEVKHTLLEHDGELAVEGVGPIDLLEHRQMYAMFDDPPKSFVALAKKGLPRPISGQLAVRHGVHRPTVNSLIDDLLRQSYYSQFSGSNYLSSSQLTFDLIRRSNLGIPEGKQLDMMVDAFSHSLPVLQNAPIGSILKLRESESDAFQSYRTSVVTALQTGKSARRKDVSEIFADIVGPEIDRIDRVVRKNRAALKRAIREDLVVTMGAVGIGFFSGLFPPAIGTAIGALGGVHYSSRIIKNLARLLSEPPQVQESRYYFLWKVAKRAKTKRKL